MTAAALLLLAVTGALIGMVGIGGFLLVPIVVHLQGASVRDAVAVAAITFLASGLLSVAISWRRVDVPLAPYGWFFMAAAIGAALGAFASGAASERTLTIAIALAIGSAAILEWFGIPRATGSESLSTARAVASGALTGIGSTLTGTSGPMVAMPLLAWFGMPISRRIRVGQVAQLPIALTATLVFLSLGDVPWMLAAICGCTVSLGQLVGMRCSVLLTPRGVSRFAAILMLAASASMLAPILIGSVP
jgi:uncharacterized membrane protein YfcA